MSDTPETDASVKRVNINGLAPFIEYCYADDAREIERKLQACQKHNHWFKNQFCEVVDERDKWRKLATFNDKSKHNEASEIAVRLINERDQARDERDEASQKFLALRDCLEYIANAGISARHCEDEARKALALRDQDAPLFGECPENNIIPACEDCGGELAEDLVCENIFCNPNSRDHEPGGLTVPPSLPLYSMQRCRKDNSRYGLIHFAHHDDETLCGLSINRYWWILTNNHNGKSTCPKCIKANNRDQEAGGSIGENA